MFLHLHTIHPDDHLTLIGLGFLIAGMSALVAFHELNWLIILGMIFTLVPLFRWAANP